MRVALTAPISQRSEVGDSPRVGLARLALEAALAVSGVVRADAGPHGMCVTTDPSRGLMRGASVCALADGRYAVDLCLVAGLVPLVELAEEVRSKIRARVEREGLIAQLGEVNVEFVRVLSAEEISEEEAPEHDPPPSPPEREPASVSSPITPPAPPSSNETTVAESVPQRGEPPAAEDVQQLEEALQEQALLAQELALLAQERVLLARERRLAQEREDALATETLPASAVPSDSPSHPIAPVDREGLS